jgi:hypothetical protein
MRKEVIKLIKNTKTTRNNEIKNQMKIEKEKRNERSK